LDSSTALVVMKYLFFLGKHVLNCTKLYKFVLTWTALVDMYWIVLICINLYQLGQLWSSWNTLYSFIFFLDNMYWILLICTNLYKLGQLWSSWNTFIPLLFGQHVLNCTNFYQFVLTWTALCPSWNTFFCFDNMYWIVVICTNLY